MNADPNKHNRQRTVKTRSRFTTLLTVYFFVALIIPNCVLANTEPYSGWTVEALILMPLGFYMMWSVALRRSGIMIWLAFPFIFLCADCRRQSSDPGRSGRNSSGHYRFASAL